MRKIVDKIKRSVLVKKLVYMLVGVLSYPGIALISKLRVQGMDKLKQLPKNNVLFVSNHQTYFADVITFLHIFCAVKWGKKKGLGIPYYLLWPNTRVQFVTAAETMKKNRISRLFALAGAILVKRVWTGGGNEEQKGLDPSDTRNIYRALETNWVITFPQGTTTAFAPGRRGTALIIKKCRPVVIPVVIDGFRTAFDKKGLKIRRSGVRLSVTFKDPMQFNYDDSNEIILGQIMDAIEQSETFKPDSHA